MYRHTSSYEDMERNVRDAFFSIEKLAKSYVADLNSGHINGIDLMLAISTNSVFWGLLS